MTSWTSIVGVCVIIVALAAVTGWWRYAFAAWAIRPQKMRVDRLGLLVSTPADVERVNSILGSFAGGFNAMIARPSANAWKGYCESLPALNRPFAEEGAAMGYTLRGLFSYSPAAFEADIVRPRPEFRYLHYVGLGFWSGMRNHDARQLARVTTGLDPLHGSLCYDGFGFQCAFFDYAKDEASLRKLDALEGYSRNAAYQGVGRALWFRFMDRPDLFVEHVSRFGVYAFDAAAGAGLAMVFVNPDRMELARAWAAKMPLQWHPHVHLGMCFGIKARSINNVEQFERDTAGLDSKVKEAIFASIRECDRIELLVRAERRQSLAKRLTGLLADDAYRQWRTRVTQWMVDHVEYPFAGLKASQRVTSSVEPAAEPPVSGSARGWCA